MNRFGRLGEAGCMMDPKDPAYGLLSDLLERLCGTVVGLDGGPASVAVFSVDFERELGRHYGDLHATRIRSDGEPRGPEWSRTATLVIAVNTPRIEQNGLHNLLNEVTTIIVFNQDSTDSNSAFYKPPAPSSTDHGAAGWGADSARPKPAGHAGW